MLQLEDSHQYGAVDDEICVGRLTLSEVRSTKCPFEDPNSLRHRSRYHRRLRNWRSSM